MKNLFFLRKTSLQKAFNQTFFYNLIQGFIYFALVFFILVLGRQDVFAQAPEIEWQSVIGGNASDIFTSMDATSDGGYILAGWSYSDSSADKSEDPIGEGYWHYNEFIFEYVHYNYADVWIVKVDSTGNVEWENTIGGDLTESIPYIQEISLGSYILGCNSASSISGDKTEASVGTDYWVMKLNATGEIVWQNTIGGAGGEGFRSIEPTLDGGFIIGGDSQSGISGDKSEALIGGPGGASDLWIVKLDSLGNIVWENSIGGLSSDFVYGPIHPTSDGGYIIGATSESNTGYDKTENTHGHHDYWIIKLSSTGNILWQNTIGGNWDDELYAIEETSDSGFIAIGYSMSGIAGDKTESDYGYGDYWVVKLDGSGNILWQNTLGGPKTDFPRAIKPGPFNNFIIAGYSTSNVSGDKSEACIGGYEYDYWIVNIDNNGEVIWENTIGGILRDVPNSIQINDYNKVVIGGYSNSPIGYDKTIDSIGNSDYWLMQLDCFGGLESCNLIDDNCNGLIDDAVIETVNISPAGPTTFCDGGSVLLNATYSGTVLQWKRNGINIPGETTPSYLATVKGSYSCKTSSECGTTTSLPILVNTLKSPPASITASGPTAFCVGGSVILTANTGAGLSYQWYKDAVLIPGATTINYTANLPGIYKCNVTKAATGCSKNSNGIIVSVPCREGNYFDANTFSIYPNPAADFITIQTEFSTEKTIYLTNALGQILQTMITSENTITIDLNNISSGVYFIRMEDGYSSMVEKFVKR